MRHCVLAGILGGALALFLWPPSAEAAHTKNILILRGESPELPATRVLVDDIEAAIRKAQPGSAEFYLETIDIGRFAAASDYERRLASLFEEKYRDMHLDLVVGFTEPAARFLAAERDRLFPGVPLLLGMIDQRAIDASTLP